jgi:hypothetical protein
MSIESPPFPPLGDGDPPREVRPQRYDLVTNYRCGSSIEEMERSEDGEWIRYEDVEAFLTAEPPREVQQLIEKWRKEADRCERAKDARQDPYDDTGWAYINKAQVCRAHADELSALLTAAGRDQNVGVVMSIENCSECGGTHYGSVHCPYSPAEAARLQGILDERTGTPDEPLTAAGSSREEQHEKLRDIERCLNTLWAQIPLDRRAQMMAAGFSLDPILTQVWELHADLLAAAGSSAPPQGWQPIETLTDFDRQVIMWTPKEKLWSAAQIAKSPEFCRDQVCASTRRDWTWSTHWQPLPTPPGSDRSLTPET